MSLLSFSFAFGDIFICFIFGDDHKPEESLLTLLCSSGIEAESNPETYSSLHNLFILQLFSLYPKSHKRL
jgi:hypothetical protein